ncbi:MAG: L,D-transpeptidase family protein [Deltaproteobacteria bacterium]|jgi:murein L,D-transpeptidase YcbB/YkuD|nr:L,D-transpeptidase family protein [Deltaproteobacteria bacterium]
MIHTFEIMPLHQMLKPTHYTSQYLVVIVFLLIAFQSPSIPQVLAGNTASILIKNHLKKKIALETTKERFRCRGELICGLSQIPLFYQQRDFLPAWCSDKGILPQAESLIMEIKDAYNEGLIPDDYHLANILSLIEKIKHIQDLGNTVNPELWTDLDLLLTDAFMLFASHLLAGRVNPETIHTDWTVSIPTTDLTNILQSALNENQIKKALTDFRPHHTGYLGLKTYLAHYRNIVTEIHELPLLDGARFQKGDKGRSVERLRGRLTLLGDLHADDRDPDDIFDETTEKAVRRFQKRHGLNQDGIVGPLTLNMLNISLQQRIRQIELNMERWRWIPRNIGDRHLIVNIADFKLWVTENHRREIEMRVVVGRPYRRTPVFTAKMTFMVINPYWNIPQRLAIKDILPEIQRNIHYIEQQKIKVFKDWSKHAEEIDPKTIAWNKIEPRNFTYKLRQDPGPKNVLGRMKFIFPNKFAVYLHDTPKRSLFNENDRDFSSGCIRVEDPIRLAVYLLKDDSRWTRERLMEAIENGTPQVVEVKRPLAVHLQYWTAWVDEAGQLNFRHDIYDRDRPLDRALKERRPEA